MCGILGHIFYDPQHVTDLRFEKALNTLTHRGPDGYRTYSDENIRLGHRRLSIIDLTENAAQPFVSKDEKVVMVFNGEIYNYKEISDGLELRTTSDTEVLLEGYIQYGTDFFKRIRGIYAFTIYDKRKDPLYIVARDPAGVKPFYYINNEEGFVFSSELKAILPLLNIRPEVNDEVLKNYIHLGYCLEPDTAYAGIYALKPGYCYTFSKEARELKKTEILTYDYSDQNISESEAAMQTERLLMQASKRNMVADVKVNIALSGGIDSSLVYAYANQQENSNVTGITIKFDEKEYDESLVAEAYAKHLAAPHMIESTEVSNKFELLNSLLLHFDQPYADSSFIPFYFLCNAATKHSKVLIGGDSGDEIHNGYAGHKMIPLLESIRGSVLKYPSIFLLGFLGSMAKGEKKRFIRKIKGLLKSDNLDNLIFYWESWFPPDERMYPFNPFNYDLKELKRPGSGINKFDLIEKRYLEGRMISDYLRKSDMMSMKNSLEFRVPMLDEDLTKFSLRIPYKFKSDRKQSKKILRYLHKKVYPEEFSALKKKGFTIPLDTWLGQENLNKMKDFLLRKEVFYSRYIKQDYVKYLFEAIGNPSVSEFISRPSAYQRLLVIYSLELWYQNYSQQNTH